MIHPLWTVLQGLDLAVPSSPPSTSPPTGGLPKFSTFGVCLFGIIVACVILTMLYGRTDPGRRP